MRFRHLDCSDARLEDRVQLSSPRTTFPGRPSTMVDALDTSSSGAQPERPAYDPKPTLQYASAVGLQAAGVGALASAVQNALGSHSSGAAGFLTRTGGTIGFFGA